jgi:DNA repair protein RAD16
MQWRNEIEAHTNGIKVLVWHGASRESDMEQLKKHDVVCSSPLRSLKYQLILAC